MLRVTEQAAAATGFFPVFQKIFKNRRKTVAFFGRYGIIIKLRLLWQRFSNLRPYPPRQVETSNCYCDSVAPAVFVAEVTLPLDNFIRYCGSVAPAAFVAEATWL